MSEICSVCGGSTFSSVNILWPGLIAEWQLAPHEAEYIDQQQGGHCTDCRSNLRSIVLSDAILFHASSALPLRDFVTSPAARDLRVLEINQAGNLSEVLERLPGHVLASYPQVDIQAMPYADESFDLVVHSDTLEHVRQPIRALAECRRVLRAGGALCFTAPVVVGRLTRSREGLPPSYHGNPADMRDDYLVWTEFGADIWTHVLRAGFRSTTIFARRHPIAHAISSLR
jgi:SAM-dependent methyltransferase